MPTLGTIFIGLALICVVILAARSVWRSHKTGGCSGSCGGCKGCSHGH